MKKIPSWSFLPQLCVGCKSEEIEAVIHSCDETNETCLNNADVDFSALYHE